MASSRGLLLRSSSGQKSLFNSVLPNFTVSANNSLRVSGHFLNILRQPNRSYNNSSEPEVDTDNKSSESEVDQDNQSHLLSASDFAAAIGFFPRYRELLWLQKINGTTDTSNAMEMHTKMTIDYKDRAFDEYMNISKMRPYVSTEPYPRLCRWDPLYYWMDASVDGIIDNMETSMDGITDNKNSCYYEHDFKHDISILKIVCTRDFDLHLDRASVEMGYVRFPNEHHKDTEPWKRIPLYFIPQVQGIMEAMRMDEMEFYIWGRTGSSLFTIYRDTEYCKALKTVLADFWWKHVFPAKEFCTKHKIEDPFRQLRSLMPAPKHELYGYIVKESKRIADEYMAIQIDANGKTLPT